MTKLSPIDIDPKTFLRKHCTLPPMSPIVTQIQDIISSDHISISKVAELISSDPALTAQTLKVINSAYYSLPREISDITLAVGYLGIHEIYRITLSFSVKKTFGILDKKEFDSLWSHSVYTALCAQYLKKNYEPLLHDGELWTAAILHDIGKFVYLKFFPDHFKKILEHKENKGCLFHEAEAALELPQSSYFGSILGEHWRLPQKIRTVCQNHNLDKLSSLSRESEMDAFCRLVGVANLMAELSDENLTKMKSEQIGKHICKLLPCSESDFLIHMGSVYDLKSEVDNLA